MKNTEVIHLFLYEKFTKPFIDFINDNQEEFTVENYFVIYGYERKYRSKIKGNNIIYLSSLKDIWNNKDLLKKMLLCKKIIVHGHNQSCVEFYKRAPYLLKKTCITFWGYDLYLFRDMPIDKKEKIDRIYRKYQIKHAAAVATLTKGDMEILKNLVNIRGHRFRGIYPLHEEYSETCRSLEKSTNPIKIIVGNSATRENQHIEILKILRKYKDENIQIVCPLSYGEANVVKEVSHYGKLYFGDKFMPITEYMQYNDYVDLLNKCSIGVFNNNRQQALGNIHLLNLLGSKVYIRKDTNMWEEFKNKKLKVFSVEDIENLSFEEFIHYEENYKNINYKRELYFMSDDYAIKLWKKILEN